MADRSSCVVLGKNSVMHEELQTTDCYTLQPSDIRKNRNRLCFSWSIHPVSSHSVRLFWDTATSEACSKKIWKESDKFWKSSTNRGEHSSSVSSSIEADRPSPVWRQEVRKRTFDDSCPRSPAKWNSWRRDWNWGTGGSCVSATSQLVEPRSKSSTILVGIWGNLQTKHLENNRS